jgi:hypothetical protein
MTRRKFQQYGISTFNCFVSIFGNMAEAEASAPRALLERVRRFQFDRFDPNGEEWNYYIQHLKRTGTD